MAPQGDNVRAGGPDHMLPVILSCLETLLSCSYPQHPLPPSPTKLPARVTATCARASYHRISAWSPFQRAHNTSAVCCHNLFWVMKSPREHMHLHLDAVLLLVSYWALSPSSLFGSWGFSCAVVVCLLQLPSLSLSRQHLPIVLKNVAGSFCDFFFLQGDCWTFGSSTKSWLHKTTSFRCSFE